MEARMKTIAAGPGINFGAGQIVTGARAEEFRAAGFADEVIADAPPVAPPAEAPAVEAAAIEPPETAAMPKPRKRQAGRGRG